MPKKKPYLHTFLSYSGTGIQMAATIALFGYAGSVLDTYVNSTKPWYTLISLLAGTIGSIILLIRTIQKQNL